MDIRTNTNNGLEPNRINLMHVAPERPAIFKKNQSKKKPKSLIGKLSRKITKVSQNLNREIIGGPK